MQQRVPAWSIALAISLVSCFTVSCGRADPPQSEPRQGDEAQSEVLVPDVLGCDRDEAIQEIRRSGLTAETLYEEAAADEGGKVVSQSPPAGSLLVAGDLVKLTVSRRAAAAPRVVCLDPGHAATSYNIDPDTGLNTMDYVNEPEIQIVYDIATRVRALLEDRGIEVVMTKWSAYEAVDLKQRAVIANQAGAALILHIHTDAGVSAPTTFYPGGDAEHNWKANSDSGRRAVIDPEVQAASQRMAGIFHAAMIAALGVPGGGLVVENRGPTGTGNYGPILSYDIWSEVPTFTVENNQGFAEEHRRELAQAIAEGILACLR